MEGGRAGKKIHMVAETRRNWENFSTLHNILQEK